MATDYRKEIDSRFDTLETAFSDSTRKLVRHVKAEWDKILKLKNDLAVKEDELFAAREKRMHLNEVKIQNENYWNSSKRRLENLKLSNVQLKGKLSYLKKENSRLVKTCTEQEEYMREKIAFYQEKWHKRFEMHYSKDPRLQEKQKKIKELLELKENLRNLNEEEKKYEKELFQAKCERNRRYTEESKLYPINTFVVNIAKIYMDVREAYSKCEKVCREIAATEKRIKDHKIRYQMSISIDTTLYPKISENTVMNFEHDAVNERDIFISPSKHNLEQQATDKSDDSKRNRLQSRNFEPKMVDSLNNSMQNINSSQDNSTNSDSVTSLFTKQSNVSNTSNASQKKEDNFAAKTETVQLRKPTARKWMEKLKVFLPKFTLTPEEKCERDIKEDESTAKAILTLNSDKKLKNTIQLFPEKLNKTSHHSETSGNETSIKVDPVRLINKELTIKLSSNQSASTSPAKKVTFNNTIVDIHKNLDLEMISTKNTSKYFRKNDGDTMDIQGDTSKNWGSIVANENTEVENPIKNRKNQNKLDAMNIDEKITYAEKDLYQEPDANQAMDTNEEAINTNVEAMDTNEIINTNVEAMDTNEELKESENDSLNQNVTEAKAAGENVLTATDCIIYESNKLKEIKKIPSETVSCLSFSNKERKTEQYEIIADSIEGDKSATETQDKQNAKDEKLNTVIPVQIKESIPKEMSERTSQIQNTTAPHMLMESESSRPENTSIIKEDNPNTKSLPLQPNTSQKSNTINNSPPSLPLQSNTSQKSNTINNSSPSFVSAVPTTSSPMMPSPKSVDSLPKTPLTIHSNPRTPLTSQLQNSEPHAEIDSFNVASFKSSSNSPGFAYPTRLMYQAIAANNVNHPFQNLPKEVQLQNSIFAQMAFLNNSPGIAQSPDQSDFLASAYEDYLTDSPPAIKGTEKSMFAFAEDSPENEGKDDFFPLFASDKGESSKDDTKGNGPQFTFNFGNDQQKSPEETKGFKFLF